MTNCQHCGATIDTAAVFCAQCGERLAGAPPTPSLAPAARRAPVVDTPEEVLWEGGYSPKGMIGTWILGGVASVVLLLVAALVPGAAVLAIPAILALWLGLGLWFAARRLGVHYRLTNQRFFHERGILRRVTNRIEVIDIDDISFEQGIVDRMLGVGRIKIISSDRTDPGLWLPGIDNVQKVFSLIDQARRAERLRRSLSIESI